MKLTYIQNPLMTRVELTDVERQVLWYKLKVEEMEERLYDAHFHIQEGKYYDLHQVRQAVDPDYYCSETEGPSRLDQRIDLLLSYYVEALQDSHSGDCTAFPCSCMKCHAEDLLGISTTPGMGKHMGHLVYGLFKDPGVSCEAAIERLKTSERASTDLYVKTLAWLEQYATEHLSESTAMA